MGDNRGGPPALDGLRTSADRRFCDALVDRNDVAISLAAYSVVYIVMFTAGIALMLRIAKRGPAGADEPDVIESGRPQRPVEALPEIKA